MSFIERLFGETPDSFRPKPKDERTPSDVDLHNIQIKSEEGENIPLYYALISQKELDSGYIPSDSVHSAERTLAFMRMRMPLELEKCSGQPIAEARKILSELQPLVDEALAREATKH